MDFELLEKNYLPDLLSLANVFTHDFDIDQDGNLFVGSSGDMIVRKLVTERR